ncbi:MAG: hypothetical protein ACJA0C_001074 [Candidatus Endobugula sp.]|jgi:hypothetical protein
MVFYITGKLRLKAHIEITRTALTHIISDVTLLAFRKMPYDSTDKQYGNSVIFIAVFRYEYDRFFRPISFWT